MKPMYSTFFEECGHPTMIQLTKNNPLNVSHYIKNNFKKVCDVELDTNVQHWRYTNIDNDIMFADHRSWVYFIVDNGVIKKVGETEQPLGIEDCWLGSNQPKVGTTNRFGRLRKHKGSSGYDTDEVIRNSLHASVKAKQVSLWAKQCEIVNMPIVLGGITYQIKHTMHKSLEKAILDHIRNSNKWPELNKVRG